MAIIQTKPSFFFAFASRLISQLEQVGKGRMAAHYSTALNSFMRFRSGKDILLRKVDGNLLMAYESYLKEQGLCPNTSSYYMRNLRAIYNRAVENGLTVQCFPFKHVYTGIGKTLKRAVSLDMLRRIRELDLSASPALDCARDLFMFSFYTRGMSFVDMAYLKKSDLQNGVLSYRRQKTGQQLFIQWEKAMQDMLDKYDTSGVPYLLPIVRCKGKDARLQYQSASRSVNRHLKRIGELLGLPLPLTTYVARHTWASIAKSQNIPVSVISDAMGHDSEQTTRIYLASLDASKVDQANKLILKLL